MALVGGSNANNVARRILKKLLAPQLFSQFTFKGRKEKRAFSSLRISSVLIAAGLLSRGVTEHQLQQGIQTCLKHHKDSNTKHKKAD